MRQRVPLLAVLLSAVLLRVAVALYMGDSVPPAKDELSYSTLAARLATGHGYSFPTGWYPFAQPDAPSSHWSFLYTGFVGALYAVFGPHPLAPRLAGALLSGLLMPWLLYRLTRAMLWRPELSGANRLEPNPVPVFNLASAIPLVAAGLGAVYAYFVLYAAMVQTEALFICAVLWSLERGLALQRAWLEAGVWKDTLVAGLTLGLALGIATLLRQSILPWVAVMFLYLLVRGLLAVGRKPGRVWKAAGPLVLAGAVILACILPFTVRNHRAYGSFLLLNSNAGYAMYSAQHPLHGTSFQEYAAAPLPEDLVNQGLNEAHWDKELMRRGIGFVLAEPVRYLLLSLSRVRDYVEFWPTLDSSALFNGGRILSIGVLLPFMVGGVAYALTRRGRQVFELQSTGFILLFIAFYSVLHIFTWAMSRYRLPVDAAALPFASLALCALAERFARGRRTVRTEIA